MDNFNKKIAEIYEKRFDNLGPVPQASLWFSKERQMTRFQIITDQILSLKLGSSLQIGDIGCGYGEYFRYLLDNNPGLFERYYGYDIATNLINYCKNNCPSSKASYFVDQVPKLPLHINVMSGTFNLAPTSNLSLWKEHVCDLLKAIWKKTKVAMIFNLQVGPQSEIKKQGIVYFNLDEITNFCKKFFGPTKVIKHQGLPNDATFLVKRI